MEYDSDSTNGEEDGILSKEQEEDNEEESTSSSSSEEPLGDVWERGVDFEPPLPTPADFFAQNFTRRSNKTKVVSSAQLDQSTLQTRHGSRFSQIQYLTRLSSIRMSVRECLLEI